MGSLKYFDLISIGRSLKRSDPKKWRITHEVDWILSCGKILIEDEGWVSLHLPSQKFVNNARSMFEITNRLAESAEIQ